MILQPRNPPSIQLQYVHPRDNLSTVMGSEYYNWGLFLGFWSRRSIFIGAFFIFVFRSLGNRVHGLFYVKMIWSYSIPVWRLEELYSLSEIDFLKNYPYLHGLGYVNHPWVWWATPSEPKTLDWPERLRPFLGQLALDGFGSKERVFRLASWPNPILSVN